MTPPGWGRFWCAYWYAKAMKESDIERSGLRSLKRIESDLEEIRDRSSNPRRAFVSGIIYGAGAFFGGVMAIILFGWVLSLAGLIPGFADLAGSVNSMIQNSRGR